MKQEIIEFRKEIAALEVEQRKVKEQRKIVRFTGERTMSPVEAYYTAKDNKHTLRAMYAAYGLMRGKTFDQIENKAKPIDDSWPSYLQGRHPLFLLISDIDTFLRHYGYQLVYEEKFVKTCWGEEKVKIYHDACEEIVRAGE